MNNTIPNVRSIALAQIDGDNGSKTKRYNDGGYEHS